MYTHKMWILTIYISEITFGTLYMTMTWTITWGREAKNGFTISRKINALHFHRRSSFLSAKEEVVIWEEMVLLRTRQDKCVILLLFVAYTIQKDVREGSPELYFLCKILLFVECSMHNYFLKGCTKKKENKIMFCSIYYVAW